MIWILTWEVLGYFDHRIATLRFMEASRDEFLNLENAQNLSLTVLWAVYASALLAVGIFGKLRAVRLAGLHCSRYRWPRSSYTMCFNWNKPTESPPS